MLHPTIANRHNAPPAGELAETGDRAFTLHPWAPRALALIDQPVLVVKLQDLSLVWANDAAQRRLASAAAGRAPQPQYLLPELEAWQDEGGPDLLPAGFCLSWTSHLPAGRREGDVALQLGVTLEVLAGEPEGLALLVIAERQEASRSDEHAQEQPAPATLDSLTGLPQRQYFEERLCESLELQNQGGQPIAVAFLDVDHFKQVNDRHGHMAGDDVLRALADCLRRSLRPGDIVARYGGDEFVVLLHGVRSLKQGRGVARRLKQALAAEREQLCTTASLGLAVVNVCQADPRQVLQAADDAMFIAKRRGHAGHVEVRQLVSASAGEVPA